MPGFFDCNRKDITSITSYPGGNYSEEKGNQGNSITENFTKKGYGNDLERSERFKIIWAEENKKD